VSSVSRASTACAGAGTKPGWGGAIGVSQPLDSPRRPDRSGDTPVATGVAASSVLARLAGLASDRRPTFCPVGSPPAKSISRVPIALFQPLAPGARVAVPGAKRGWPAMRATVALTPAAARTPTAALAIRGIVNGGGESWPAGRASRPILARMSGRTAPGNSRTVPAQAVSWGRDADAGARPARRVLSLCRTVFGATAVRFCVPDVGKSGERRGAGVCEIAEPSCGCCARLYGVTDRVRWRDESSVWGTSPSDPLVNSASGVPKGEPNQSARSSEPNRTGQEEART